MYRLVGFSNSRLNIMLHVNVAVAYSSVYTHIYMYIYLEQNYTVISSNQPSHLTKFYTRPPFLCNKIARSPCSP